jgi:hypothetical protein
MIPIMNAPSVPLADLQRHAPVVASEWFRNALCAIWDAGVRLGVDPAVMAGQCAHETSWGRFGGAVTPDMGNTCGLKVRNAKGDRREDHATFPMDFGFPLAGATAQAEHLRLYCGVPFPIGYRFTDPRAVWIGPGTSGFGTVRYVEDLSGRWAPGSTYGLSVAKAVRILWGQVGS